MELTQEDNLILQSYITISLLVELKNNNLLSSAYFEGMMFGAPWIKEQLQSIGVDNQGCTVIALYAMLVLPREIVQNAHAREYDAINDFLRNHTQNTTTNYRSDNPTTNYLRHVRNAVAHARVSFRPNDAVIFMDENSRTNEFFSTELPLTRLGEFIHRLQTVHIAYIQGIHKRGSST
ncbi:MAG: hypothetical protein HLUCCA11_01910 [Phormidesmis priestleyi Ana]|uniref:pEK499-p136 HEPN domain-containing protein n=1 Tax=Phormidesmis priestleyi Ana TaxID=1666911 RepID=A0A0P8A2L5_9CYAN|nr:MAG: hypothetical protein HLUCCA11_01910 [Phormidesmis priestleyi Ana]